MKYAGHLYKWSKPFNHVNHHWELRSVHGAVHFHVSGDHAGLEMHSIYPHGDDAPHHVNCPLTGGRCWHDGTSLYATETLWPMIQPYLKSGEHEKIFSILETEAERLAEYAPNYQPKE
jgi:hypothetical protein